MDGLPGMHRALVAGKKHGVAPIKKMVGPLAPTKYQSGYGFAAQQVILIAFASFLVGLAAAFYGPILYEVVVNGVKASPLEVNVVNMTQVPSLEGLSGLWK